MADMNPLIGGRADFAAVCNERHVKVAVEVGTDRGIFARQFLDRWLGEMLICVDPYTPYDHMMWDRTPDMQAALLHLQPHLARIRFLRATSEAAAQMFWSDLFPLPRPVGFVYIDGDHSYESVREDLRLWWGLLSAGCLMAGDDYQVPSVKRAVDEFVYQTPLKITTINDYNRSLNWCIEKPLGR
jgi:hypothetical protein